MLWIKSLKNCHGRALGAVLRTPGYFLLQQAWQILGGGGDAHIHDLQVRAAEIAEGIGYCSVADQVVGGHLYRGFRRVGTDLHDPELLRQGSYPWPLKQRILGNRGHLSNSDAAWALARLKRRPRQVLLAHLSAENNRPEVARDTVLDILRQQGIQDAASRLLITSQEERVSYQIN